MYMNTPANIISDSSYQVEQFQTSTVPDLHLELELTLPLQNCKKRTRHHITEWLETKLHEREAHATIFTFGCSL